MSVYDYIIEELDNKEFDTIAEYNDYVHGMIENLKEELGKAERCFTGDRGWEGTDVVIKEVLEEEEKEYQETEDKYNKLFKEGE